jgi:2-polyprenyl-6-methoxyphenol hydroxylase-like FAD-dependent oxidoreductase
MTQKIRCKYLYGADGAKSIVVQQLGLPMSIQPSQGIALNVLLRADLSDIMGPRVGNLHYVIQPDVEQPDFAAWSIVRMVKPWYEWLVIMMYKPTCPADFMPEKRQVEEQIKSVIGDSTILVDILRIDKWVINETVAEYYSKGQV